MRKEAQRKCHSGDDFIGTGIARSIQSVKVVLARSTPFIKGNDRQPHEAEWRRDHGVRNLCVET
jgi:hypothetical protein